MRFSNDILKWYKVSHRKLPWRNSRDPYMIWLSEIILQQTRVEQGMDYYLRFTEKYPSIEMLASASESEVLKLWQGLGYYSRARNMLIAARQVMTEFGGVFPESFEKIKMLKGVGDYTAAAVASIAFGEAVPVVDGNVKRLISRLYGLEDCGNVLYQKVRDIMFAEMDPEQAGDYNQAVMEFGALHCTPRQARCGDCIFKEICVARRDGRVEELPRRTAKAKPQKRYFSYLLIHIDGKGGKFFMKKRKENDIWQNLYDFPLIETPNLINAQQLKHHPDWIKWLGDGAEIVAHTKLFKHQLTHRTIIARFYTIKIRDHFASIPDSWEVISSKDLSALPIPRLIDRFIRDSNLFI